MTSCRLIKLDPELRGCIGLWMAVLGYACVVVSIVALGRYFFEQLL